MLRLVAGDDTVIGVELLKAGWAKHSEVFMLS